MSSATLFSGSPANSCGVPATSNSLLAAAAVTSSLVRRLITQEMSTLNGSRLLLATSPTAVSSKPSTARLMAAISAVIVAMRFDGACFPAVLFELTYCNISRINFSVSRCIFSAACSGVSMSLKMLW